MPDIRSTRRPPALRVIEPRIPAATADTDINGQLARVLRSETFQQADRLKRFLTFIVSETIAGRGGDLKEYVIGVQVFRKEDSFDPRTDPIVRVQARRLRAKLVHYYREEGRADALVIELPKGGYAPTIKRRDEPTAGKRTVAAALASRNTVAVLPFADHTADRSLEAFCQGVREELIHRLTGLSGLRVLALRGDDEAANAGAALLVEGSVRRSGSRMRTTVHLVDAASGSYAWSEAFDAAASDPLDAQEHVARTVARRLEPEAGGARAQRINRPPENLAAQNLYLQGRYHLSQRTDDGLSKALDFFERALIEDAQYGLAHSGLADAYGLLAHYGVRGPAEVWTKAASSAVTAVMLDDSSAEAHTSLAHVRATQDWDWAGADREFRRAIALNPRYATAHHWYAASCLAPLGRLDEALDEVRIAQSLDPVSSIIARDVAMMHFYRRDFDAALDQCDHTIELNPHFAPAYWLLGVIQEQRRDLDEALAAFQRASHLSPETPRMLGALGRTSALAGDFRAAREILQTLETCARERYVSPLEFAWVHFALGEVDFGFDRLGQACDDRSFDLISLNVDPRFDALRDDGRFSAVLRQLKLDR